MHSHLHTCNTGASIINYWCGCIQLLNQSCNWTKTNPILNACKENVEKAGTYGLDSKLFCYWAGIETYLILVKSDILL